MTTFGQFEKAAIDCWREIAEEDIVEVNWIDLN
jgi:hypothetical protein